MSVTSSTPSPIAHRCHHYIDTNNIIIIRAIHVAHVAIIKYTKSHFNWWKFVLTILLISYIFADNAAYGVAGGLNLITKHKVLPKMEQIIIILWTMISETHDCWRSSHIRTTHTHIAGSNGKLVEFKNRIYRNRKLNYVFLNYMGNSKVIISIYLNYCTYVSTIVGVTTSTTTAATAATTTGTEGIGRSSSSNGSSAMSAMSAHIFVLQLWFRSDSDLLHNIYYAIKIFVQQIIS